MKKNICLKFGICLLGLFFLFGGCYKKTVLGDSNYYELRSVVDTFPESVRPYLAVSLAFDGYHYSSRYNLASPCFNPNNPYQICFLVHDTTVKDRSLYRYLWGYDFRENRKWKIAENVNGENPVSWSSRDWILYRGFQGQIYKVKSNGDSLTQLTWNPYSNGEPSWNPEGTLFVHGALDTTLLMLSDANGRIQNTLPVFGGNCRWESNNCLYFVYSSQSQQKNWFGVGYYDFATRVIHRVDSSDNTSAHDYFIRYAAQQKDNLIWSSCREIVQVNPSTGFARKLRISTENKKYGCFTISKDGKSMIVSRENRIWYDHYFYRVATELFYVDLENPIIERKINIF